MYGWICPKCGKVYGPTIIECGTCNGKDLCWSITSTSIAKEDYNKWKEGNTYYGKDDINK